MNYSIPTLVLLLSSCASYLPQESVVAPERTAEHRDFTPTPSDFRFGIVSATAEDNYGETAQLGVDQLVGFAVQYAKQSANNEDLYWYVDGNFAAADGGYGGYEVQATRLALSGGAEYRLRSESNPGAYVFAQAGLGFTKADISTAYGSVSGTGIGLSLGLGANYTPPGGSLGVFVLFRPIEPTVEIESVDVSTSSATVGLTWSR